MSIVCHQHDRVGTWVMERTGLEWYPGRGTTMGLEDSRGNLVAGFVFEAYNGTNMFVHAAARKGQVSRGFLYACFDYCFHQLACKRITSLVDEFNDPCQRFVQGMGAVEETRLTAAGIGGGDMLVYVMTPESCKFLEDK